MLVVFYICPQIPAGHICNLTLTITETCTMSKLVRMSSDQDIEISFEEVPQAKDFQFKINDPEGVKELLYTLKKGKILPYQFSYDGI